MNCTAFELRRRNKQHTKLHEASVARGSFILLARNLDGAIQKNLGCKKSKKSVGSTFCDKKSCVTQKKDWQHFLASLRNVTDVTIQ